MIMLGVAWFLLVVSGLCSGCGSSAQPVAHTPTDTERPDNRQPAPEASDDEEHDDHGSDNPAFRRIEVSWDGLADPHSLDALIVRTDMEWEDLFTGSVPDRTIDFNSSVVVGLVEADVLSVRIDDVHVDGGAVVVSVSVGQPNPQCGETPMGSVDLGVIGHTDLPIRFQIERSPTHCAAETRRSE